jgi:hypothetical protein
MLLVPCASHHQFLIPPALNYLSCFVCLLAVSCSQMCTALIRNLSMLAATASALMAITNGDLPGWLGSLAPSGTLTSTQLFYRIAGVYTSVLSLQVPSSLKSYLEGAVWCGGQIGPAAWGLR